jgi:endonuclease/exonuclease/phosphatase family metal-dependent hydrolase
MKKPSSPWQLLLIIALFFIKTAGAQPYDFKITTWNVEWLSCLTNGPSDRELQVNNVVSMIKTMNSDLVALQEVGTSNLYTTMDTLVRRLGSDWDGRIVPWKVGNCNQSQGIIYKKSKINIINSSLITNGGTSYDWSSGRFPVLYNVNFIAGDALIPVSFFNIHAKAYSDEASYNRRKNASVGLKNLIDGSSIYSAKRVVILGDFNDYLNGTTCSTCGGNSPYKNFIDDDSHYQGVTINLTHPYYHNPVIDNIIISSQLFDEYLTNSAFNEVSATQTIPNYYATTSDHIPVSISFSISNGVNITEQPAKSSFYVYPNPATGELVVTSYELRVTNVEIFDVYGRKCHVINSPPFMEGWQPKADGVVLDISHLSTGIYIIKIGGVCQKFVKQ